MTLKIVQFSNKKEAKDKFVCLFLQMEYFKKLQELLKIEKAEDQNQFVLQTANASTSEKRANGLTWYPIAIRGTELNRADYIIVEIERTTHQDIVHQFRNGASAVLFSNHDPKNDRIEGVINFQYNNRIKITLKTDELPDWTRDGKLGLDLLFDDNSYHEMEKALQEAQSNKEGNLDVLLNLKAPTFKPQPSFTRNFEQLNTAQNQAVQQIIAANELAIIHGPPGTGKTTTLVQAIKTLVKEHHEKILVVAPSNVAVDFLSEKLDKEGLNVLRIGNPSRVTESLLNLTLEAKMKDHDLTKENKRLKKQAQEFKNMAHKYKRSFGKAEREQRKALFDEAHRIMKDVEKTEEYLIEDIVKSTQVITATLVGSNHYTIKNLKFDTVFIDEAGQALEPACWIPILKADKVVLAGDHCQLSPTIKSEIAKNKGLGETLLEKSIANHPEAVTLLEEQYRMNTEIMGFSSKYFYKNRLIAHESVAKNRLFEGDAPFTLIDTAGCGFEEKLEGTSSTNPEEAALLIKYLANFLSEATIDFAPSIGIISPYKQQINILKTLVENDESLKPWLNNIAVNTIDSFQGQEKDLILISLVRSNKQGEIGFLADERRMNVAMTRAKKKLVMVGDSATLGNNKFFAELITYTEEIGGYLSAWEL